MSLNPDPNAASPFPPLPPLSEPDRERRLSEASLVAAKIRDRLSDAILGRDNAIEMVLISLLAGGHILLEDYPGSGKTMLARALGESIESDGRDGTIAPFRRIQFTPDLLPSDITGVSVFQPDRNCFEFLPGPVFTHILLADEINRTSPKVQAALLEAMAERQVTVDNVTRRLNDLFLVIATQNPLGLAGTFPLPAPQLDRFLFKVRMDYIARDAELEVVQSFSRRLHPTVPNLPKVKSSEVVSATRTLEQETQIHVSLTECLVDLARIVRMDERVAQGISTRALVQAVPALAARALLHGRDYVSTEDIETLAVPLFAHRIALAPGVTDAEPIVLQSLHKPLETATRATLRR